MAQPVVHFEIIGEDPARLREYFSELFGWRFATPSTVAEEVSAPNDYGFLDLIAADDGAGIRGGVGGGPTYKSHAVFYVGVPDVGVALQRAEDLGGTRVMGPVTSPNGLVVGHFQDPEGSDRSGRPRVAAPDPAADGARTRAPTNFSPAGVTEKRFGPSDARTRRGGAPFGQGVKPCVISHRPIAESRISAYGVSGFQNDLVRSTSARWPSENSSSTLSQPGTK
jgi:uncharacterized protein